jgi:hypothetical protein
MAAGTAARMVAARATRVVTIRSKTTIKGKKGADRHGHRTSLPYLGTAWLSGTYSSHINCSKFLNFKKCLIRRDI